MQCVYAVINIVTPTIAVRLTVGWNSEGGDILDWDGRVFPDLEF